jgi:hypothetical protein
LQGGNGVVGKIRAHVMHVIVAVPSLAF